MHPNDAHPVRIGNNKNYRFGGAALDPEASVASLPMASVASLGYSQKPWDLPGPHTRSHFTSRRTPGRPRDPREVPGPPGGPGTPGPQCTISLRRMALNIRMFIEMLGVKTIGNHLNGQAW